MTAPRPIAVAVVEQKARFLVGQRAADLELGGLWEFPGGKIEHGELPEDAAARECKEETGIAVFCHHPLLICEHEYPHDLVRIHFFYCTPLDNSNCEPRPPFQWIPRNKLKQFQFPAANQALLDRLA